MRTLLASVIVTGAVFEIAFERVFLPALKAEEPALPKSAKNDAPGLKINRETTYITAPLDKDGDVDYTAALTELLGKGVTPENNANVPLIRALGPGPGDRPADYYKRLGMERPPERGDYFVDLRDHLKNNVKLEWAKRQEKEAELERVLVRPWTAKAQPEAAAWLKSNEKPLALVVEAGKRGRYFSSLVSHAAAFAAAPRYELIVNNDAAMRKGVSIAKALGNLNVLIGSTYELGSIRFNQFYRAYVQTAPELQKLPEDLDDLFIKNNQGLMVPYSSFMEINKTPGLNEIAKALVARAMLHLGEKRWSDAWSDLLACHRLGRAIGSSPTLLENSTAIAIDAIASRGDLVFIDRADIGAKQFVQCMDDLRALPPLPSIANGFEHGERLYLLETAANVRKGGFPHLYQLYFLGENRRDEAFDKRFIAEKAGPETRGLLDDVDWNPIFRECNRSVDEIVAVLREKDRSKREKLLQTLDEKQKPSDTTKADDLRALVKKMKSDEKVRFLLKAFNPHIEGVHSIQLAADCGEQIQRNLQIAFALAAYRRAEGKYPPSLEQLAPKYLTRVPTDSFSDKPLTYRSTEKGYEIRSGADAKSGGPFLDERPLLDFPNVRMPVPEPKPK